MNSEQQKIVFIYLKVLQLLDRNCLPKRYMSDFMVNLAKSVRDGPFDIRGGGGGGWDFSSRQVIFFSLYAQPTIFFKSKLQQVFLTHFFEKITHSNQKNVNKSNTLNEKVQKTLNFYLIISCQ